MIAFLAFILSLAGFAEARDRNSDRDGIRRPHHERQIRERNRAISDGSARRHYRSDRRRERVLLGNRNVGRRYDARRYDNRRQNETRFGPSQRFGETRFGRDPRRNRQRPGRQIVVREFRGDDWGYWEPAYGGTYFGGLSAWRDPGNGTYFRSERYSERENDGYDYSERDTYLERNTVDRPSGPRIIRVNPSSAGRACSWESGVCVIRR